MAMINICQNCFASDIPLVSTMEVNNRHDDASCRMVCWPCAWAASSSVSRPQKMPLMITAQPHSSLLSNHHTTTVPMQVATPAPDTTMINVCQGCFCSDKPLVQFTTSNNNNNNNHASASDGRLLCWQCASSAAMDANQERGTTSLSQQAPTSPVSVMQDTTTDDDRMMIGNPCCQSCFTSERPVSEVYVETSESYQQLCSLCASAPRVGTGPFGNSSKRFKLSQPAVRIASPPRNIPNMPSTAPDDYRPTKRQRFDNGPNGTSMDWWARGTTCVSAA